MKLEKLTCSLAERDNTHYAVTQSLLMAVRKAALTPNTEYCKIQTIGLNSSFSEYTKATVSKSFVNLMFYVEKQNNTS